MIRRGESCARRVCRSVVYPRHVWAAFSLFSSALAIDCEVRLLVSHCTGPFERIQISKNLWSFCGVSAICCGHLLGREFGVDSLGADIRWIVTHWYLRMRHHLSYVQALYEQETAIHVSGHSQASALHLTHLSVVIQKNFALAVHVRHWCAQCR